jgi:hypothetical protein
MKYTADLVNDKVNAEMTVAEFQLLLRWVQDNGGTFDVVATGDHNALTVRPARLETKVFYMASERRPNISYKITLDIVNGVIVSALCECPDYNYRHAQKGTECKHIGRARVLMHRASGSFLT